MDDGGYPPTDENYSIADNGVKYGLFAGRELILIAARKEHLEGADKYHADRNGRRDNEKPLHYGLKQSFNGAVLTVSASTRAERVKKSYRLWIISATHG